MKIDSIIITPKVTALRKARDMTQGQLGAQIGMSDGNLSRIESGKRKMTMEIAVALSAALKCELADLFDHQVKGD